MDMWERELDAQNDVFSELADDEGELFQVIRKRRPWMNNGKQRQPAYEERDLLGGTDSVNFYDHNDDRRYVEDAYDVQVTSRQKEEALAAAALQRIQQAQMQGADSVALAREEIDALKRTNILDTSLDEHGRRGVADAEPAQRPRRRLGTFLGLGATSSAARTKLSKTARKPRMTLRESPQSSSGMSTPDQSPRGESTRVPLDYSNLPVNRQRPSPPKEQRTPSGNPRLPTHLPYPDLPPPRNFSAPGPNRSISQEYPIAEHTNHVTTQLRSRSISAVQMPTMDRLPRVGGRRNFSGPATPPPQVIRRVPVGSARSHPGLYGTSSGLTKEIIEISSGDDIGDCNNVGDDDSDEGAWVNFPGPADREFTKQDSKYRRIHDNHNLHDRY